MALAEKRKQRLLLYLSNKREYATASELSRVLDVSTKTVYRLIKDINNQASDSSLVYSRKGSGYKLNYEQYVKLPSSKIKNTSVSSTERRNNVLEELLLSSPKEKNVFELYEKYYVSETVITSDEKIISEILEKYDLDLVRQHNHLKILGEESRIRRAINDLIQTTKTLDNDEMKLSENSNFNRYDAEFINYQMKIIENKLKITFPHPYDVNIFSHLYILLSRFRKTGDLFSNQSINLDEKRFEEMEKEKPLYEMAKEIKRNIETYLNTELPKVEVYFLFQYLISSRMQNLAGTKGIKKEVSNKIENITNFYMNAMSKKLNLDFNKENLFFNLSKHIQPMVNRLEHGIYVKNNILEQIKLEYDHIFSKVEEVSEEFSQKYNLPSVNEDENGFLTLYFAQTIESASNEINTIIMCTTGIGTSELLRVKITKRFTELKIIDVVASSNINDVLEMYPETELIITTLKPLNENNVPTLVVSAMFMYEDQERVQRVIEDFKHGKKANI